MTQLKQGFGGKYTTTDIMLEGDLHTRILQTKLTPNLGSLIPVVQDELEHAMRDELPISNGMQFSISIFVMQI